MVGGSANLQCLLTQVQELVGNAALPAKKSRVITSKCLSQGYYCWDETMWPKKLGVGKVYLVYAPPSSKEDRNSRRTGTWRQKLVQKPWRSAANRLLPLECCGPLASPACSVCFLTEPRTASPRMASPTMGWALPINHSLRICLAGSPAARSHECIFLTLRFPPLVRFYLVSSWHRTYPTDSHTYIER